MKEKTFKIKKYKDYIINTAFGFGLGFLTKYILILTMYIYSLAESKNMSLIEISQMFSNKKLFLIIIHLVPAIFFGTISIILTVLANWRKKKVRVKTYVTILYIVLFIWIIGSQSAGVS
jgi:hypothetical protein